jgi:hypothetical protein
MGSAAGGLAAAGRIHALRRGVLDDPGDPLDPGSLRHLGHQAAIARPNSITD